MNPPPLIDDRLREFLRTAPRVAVVGGAAADGDTLERAETLGRLIAREGFILINGGRGGVMEASARGARSGGGIVLAILPGNRRDEANSWVDIPVATGLGHLRNALVAGNAEVVVALAGGFGTLSEIAHARLHHIPVLGLGFAMDIPGIERLETPEQVIPAIRKYLEA